MEVVDILLRIAFSLAIFILAFFASKKVKRAAFCGALAAVLSFSGSDIIEDINKLMVRNKESQVKESQNEQAAAKQVQGEEPQAEENQNEQAQAEQTESEGMNAESLVAPEEHIHEIAYTLKENSQAAECLNAGSYESVSYCECGEELKREIIDIPALEHDFIDGICSRCHSVSPDYETMIIARANEYTDKQNYDEALLLVNEALGLVDSETLRQLYTDILMEQQEADSSVSYTARPVEFITHSGSISDNDDVDVYKLTASVDGYYHFGVSDMVNGLAVNLHIYDENDKQIGGYDTVRNDGGDTCILKKGCSYSVKVKYRSGTGNYTLTIGQQKITVNATARDVIYDGIEFTGQRNEYTFVPAIDGDYGFYVSDMVNGFAVRLYVYDSLGYKLGGYDIVRNDGGVTVEMIAGETYTVVIGQNDNLGSYTLAIGKQLPAQEVTGQNIISGELTFKRQKNEYIYTPSSTGNYHFTLQNMPAGFRVKFYIYDSLGYKINGYDNVINGNVVKADLNANETYIIRITQNENYGSYQVNISK